MLSKKDVKKAKVSELEHFLMKIDRLQLWQVLILISNFAFEFFKHDGQSTCKRFCSNYFWLQKTTPTHNILTMFDKNNVKLGGEGKVVEISSTIEVVIL